MWDGHRGGIEVTRNHIELVPCSSIARSLPYRQDIKGREFEGNTCAKLCEQGAIFPSNYEWASLVVFATMPQNKGLRFCIDYRKLNARTNRDSYSLPQIDECAGSLGDVKFFTTLDVNKEFWQMAIDPIDYEKQLLSLTKVYLNGEECISG